MTLLYEQESYIIRGGCYEVYKKFRNRHKEKVYGRSLVSYLKKEGLQIEQEKQVPIYFGSEKVGVYTPDIIVEGKIFLELKCKPKIVKDDMKQFWYYMKATGYPLGFLINFGAADGVQIIRRVYSERSASVLRISSDSVQ